MTPEEARLYPPLPVTLKNGAPACVRLLAPEDGEALAAFYAAVPRGDIRFYCPHALDREQAFKNAAAAHSPHEIVLVLALPDGAIGGYAWTRWWKAEARESVFGICIRPDLQGSGAGRALMTRLFEICRAVGPPVVRLTVQKANARALALYQSMGFRIVKEQMRQARDEFGAEPEYVMEWRRAP